MPSKALVVDANILIWAVLGKRVRQIVERYSETVFFVPESAYAEAAEYLPELVVKHGGDPQNALVFLRALMAPMRLIGRDVYGEFEAMARERLGRRDPDGWPILAAALAIGCPIWTEDTDFFGCGVATWTSASVELFLRSEWTLYASAYTPGEVRGIHPRGYLFPVGSPRLVITPGGVLSINVRSG